MIHFDQKGCINSTVIHTEGVSERESAREREMLALMMYVTLCVHYCYSQRYQDQVAAYVREAIHRSKPTD